MKILFVSDVVVPEIYPRFQAERFTDMGAVVSCGDLPPEYLTFLADRLKTVVYFVRGNHDIRYQTYSPPGCVDLDGRIIEIGGLRFLGLEGSRWYNGNPVQYTEWQMRMKIATLIWSLWRNKADIVVTHAPPRYVGDAEDLCHRGFKSFRKLIYKYKPSYFVHGHIHSVFSRPEDRIKTLHQTKVINAYGFYILEIENRRHVQEAGGMD